MSERDRSGAAEPGPFGRALVGRLAAGRLPGFVARRVHARLARDEGLARYYDTLRRIERAAAGSTGLGAEQKRLVGAMLFAGAPSPSPTRELAPSSWPRALVALAGATAALVLFVRIEGASPVTEDSSFTARGAGEVAVGVRARCLAASGERVLSQAEAGVGPTVAPPELACPDGGLLALSATNRGARDAWVFVVGVGSDGDTRWIAPFDRAARSVRVGEGAVDRVLGDLATLESRGAGERLALHALFSARPLHADDVEAALALARRQGLEVAKLARLPVDARAQARLDVVVTRGGGVPP